MSYRLLDSGNFEKLEQIGEFRVVRPAAQAVWSHTLGPDEWQKWDARYERYSDGKGEWKKLSSIPVNWPVEIASSLRLGMKLTSFGHLGVFAEQEQNWRKLRSECERLRAVTGQAPEVLNLFAYTGASSIACAQGGATVVHVDASKGTVDWARANFELNGLGAHPVRYMVDDATKFVEREVRRTRRYHGIILDPPSYGRGAEKQVWKIETDLVPLLKLLKELLVPGGFLQLSCHSPGYTPVSLQNLIAQVFKKNPSAIEANEMIIPAEAGFSLPSGVTAWLANS